MGRRTRRVAGLLTGALGGLVAWPLLVEAAPVPTDERQAESALSSVITFEMPPELAWPDLGPADPVTAPGTLTVDVEMQGHRFASGVDTSDEPAAEGSAAPVPALATPRPVALPAPAAIEAPASAVAAQTAGRSWLDWAGLGLAAAVVLVMALAVLRPGSPQRVG